MSERRDVTSRRQRRYEKKSQGWRAQSGLRAPEWQCAACKTRLFLSRDTCRGCGKQTDVEHDDYINEWSHTVAWPQQGGGSSREFLWRGGPLWHQTEGTGPSSCDGQTTTGTSRSIGVTRSMHPHLGKRGAAGGGGVEAGSALGIEDGPSADQVPPCCRIWREGAGCNAEGPREFRARTAGGDASPDRPGDAHAGSPAVSDASSTSQHPWKL